MWLALVILEGSWTSSEPLDGERLEQLVESARSGSSPAAAEIYVALAKRVYRCLRPLCSSDAEAEDLVQDVFVRAFAALHRYWARPGEGFVGWLMTLALNLARQRHRRDGNRQRLARQQLRECEPAPSPEEHVQRAEQRARLLSALESSSERDREILCLRYGAQLSAEEVARSCNTSISNVRKICERQRRQLSACLQPDLVGYGARPAGIQEQDHEA